MQKTGAGQHGVGTANGSAVLGLKAEIYMASIDVERQKLNLFRMELLGAKVHRVDSGTRTLKDAINEALRDWITNVKDTYYLIGSVVGPHPYPMIVRDFQSVIGEEIKSQLKDLTTTASTSSPNALVCCVGGGSNAMGTFFPFLDDNKVSLYGVEAGGMGLKTGKHSATLKVGSEGILHGMRTYLLQDEFGQINDTHSISAGLDYPGVGPQHVQLKEIERAEYVTCNDKEALDAFFKLSRLEGIIAALESCHGSFIRNEVGKKMEEINIIVYIVL